METEMNNTTPDSTPAATTVERYEELKAKVAAMEDDFVRFYLHGNKAAGTRVRNAMQDLKVFAQTVRTEVQAKKNEGKPAS
jgi:hypothetical protein